MSPAVLKPDNGAGNARLVGDPSLCERVSVRPQPLCRAVPAGHTAADGTPEPMATTAEVLEALHRATGMPIVADYYTRLYKPEAVSVRNLPLFETLSRLADATRMRWSKDGLWLQFRSTSYYDDRLKEVPNRLLERWRAARRQQGALTLDDLVEIAQLPDAQLDGGDMAEGAQACWGLAEWGLARHGGLRPHLRFLAGFTPEQRQEAMTAAGLPFSRMSLAQQQQFLARALEFKAPPLQSLDDMSGAVLRVQYTQPGGFQWGESPGVYTHWRVPLASGRRVPRPLVQARTRKAALQAVRQVDLPIREALLQALRRGVPDWPWLRGPTLPWRAWKSCKLCPQSWT
jgi:hypothetical protein